jgi:hypothetical protein
VPAVRGHPGLFVAPDDPSRGSDGCAGSSRDCTPDAGNKVAAASFAPLQARMRCPPAATAQWPLSLRDTVAQALRSVFAKVARSSRIAPAPADGGGGGAGGAADFPSPASVKRLATMPSAVREAMTPASQLRLLAIPEGSSSKINPHASPWDVQGGAGARAAPTAQHQLQVMGALSAIATLKSTHAYGRPPTPT